MEADTLGIIGGIVIGLMIMGAIWVIVYGESFDISQETGDDICRQLTGNESAVAKDSGGKLICLIPSYDETQNIIIKSNQEE